MTPDEALRRVRDPHEVLQLTDVELTEAAVALALEVEQLRAAEARVRHAAGITFDDPMVAPASAATAERILRALDGRG